MKGVPKLQFIKAEQLSFILKERGIKRMWSITSSFLFGWASQTLFG